MIVNIKLFGLAEKHIGRTGLYIFTRSISKKYTTDVKYMYTISMTYLYF